MPAGHTDGHPRGSFRSTGSMALQAGPSLLSETQWFVAWRLRHLRQWSAIWHGWKDGDVGQHLHAPCGKRRMSPPPSDALPL